MDYEKEIKKHKEAINDIYKQQQKDKLKNYYIIFACFDTNNMVTSKRKYYINNLGTDDGYKNKFMDGLSEQKEFLFTKQETIDFANNSKEPEIIKAGIKSATIIEPDILYMY